jgi:predicted dehydrogenase
MAVLTGRHLGREARGRQRDRGPTAGPTRIPRPVFAWARRREVLPAPVVAVRLAILGCGAWGQNHVRAALRLDGAELVAAYDPRAEALAQVARRAPHVRLATSAAEAVAAADAVIVAAPAPLHGALARVALAAGRDVLVEKPLTLDLAEAEALVAEAHHHERVLMVGHVLRYHPAFRALEARANSGALGELTELVAVRTNPVHTRTDERALWSLAPHDVSMVCALMGTAPVEVRATGHEDLLSMVLRFSTGALAHLHTSWLDRDKRRLLTVVGRRGVVVFDDAHEQHKLRSYAAPGEPSEVLAYAAIEPLFAEQSHFVACVRTRTPPLSDGAEALRVMRVLVAASESLKSGAQPVRLSQESSP